MRPPDHPELVRHLVLASGCCSELPSHVFLAHDLGYLPRPGTRALITGIRALRSQIWACIRHLRPNGESGRPRGGSDARKRWSAKSGTGGKLGSC